MLILLASHSTHIFSNVYLLHYIFHFITFFQQHFYISPAILFFLLSLHWEHSLRQCLIDSVWFLHAEFMHVSCLLNLPSVLPTIFVVTLLLFNVWFDVLQFDCTVFPLPLPFGISSSLDGQVVVCIRLIFLCLFCCFYLLLHFF